jgi:hypothetical protein
MKSTLAMLLLFGALISGGCHGKHLSVCQQLIDRNYLASTHVRTPDPKQDNPPFGQLIIVNWWIPERVLENHAVLKIDIVYWNYTQETIAIPLTKRWGHHQVFLLDKEFEEKKGFLTYRAFVETQDGEVFAEWKHQLWVNLITIDEMQNETFGDQNPPLMDLDTDQEKEFDYQEAEDLDFEPSPSSV